MLAIYVSWEKQYPKSQGMETLHCGIRESGIRQKEKQLAYLQVKNPDTSLTYQTSKARSDPTCRRQMGRNFQDLEICQGGVREHEV